MLISQFPCKCNVTLSICVLLQDQTDKFTVHVGAIHEWSKKGSRPGKKNAHMGFCWQRITDETLITSN